MILAFLHARQDPGLALLMLDSALRFMPGLECVQLTDEDTPKIPGCQAKRLPWEAPMRLRLRHLSELRGEVILLDTDVIVQRDLRGVFRFPFDVALTKRDGPIRDRDGVDIVPAMPYNMGVAFSRSPQFWRACLEASEGENQWFADQIAAAKVAPGFNVLKLHCDNFNYSPGNADEDVSMRFAVHYKGTRKPWMIARFQREKSVA